MSISARLLVRPVYYLYSLHLSMYPAVHDVRMPSFVLAVFYTGLFFMLQRRRE